MHDTSELLAVKVERLAKEQHFPIQQRGEDLVGEIFNLLIENKGVNKVYEAFRIPVGGRRR
ncbi:hypothetical protein [Vreelandella lionensis]|nr:hypothetical protein [Halomonas lionensis]